MIARWVSIGARTAGLWVFILSALPCFADDGRRGQLLPPNFDLTTIVEAMHDPAIPPMENLARQEAAVLLTQEMMPLGFEGDANRLIAELRKRNDVPIGCYGDKRCRRHVSHVNDVRASVDFRNEYRTTLANVLPAAALAEFDKATQWYAARRSSMSKDTTRAAIDFSALVALIVSLVWVARRRFYRTVSYRTEAFSSFSSMVGSKTLETIVVLSAFAFFMYRLTR